jgi:predicted phage-related endonuclease
MAKMTKAIAREKIEEYLNLQAVIKTATKEADAIKAELKELAEANETRTYTVNDHAVIVTTATRNTVDAKALAAAHPKIAAKFTKETWYDTVRIK